MKLGWFGGGRGDASAAPPDPRFPKDWCVVALLIAAAMADGEVAPEEEIEIDALAIRARSLVGMSQERLTACVKDCQDVLAGANSVASLTELACEKLAAEPGLPEAVYAHCVDIVLADRKVLGAEREFLDDLAKLLRIGARDATDVLAVMAWKNGFRSAP